MTRTGPYRPEADDHLTGTRALEQRIGQVIAIHEVELLYLGTMKVCRICRTKYPCATRRLLEPTT